ncbi:MAG: hypothetical protein U0T83_02890 [Bacteriovoracaceae bacterium]
MRLISLILILISFKISADVVKTTYIENFVSPITTNAKFILLGGSAATANSWITHDSYGYQKRISYKDSQPFKQFGVIGAYLGLGFLNMSYAGANYYLGHSQHNDKYLKRSNLMLQATAYPLM